MRPLLLTYYDTTTIASDVVAVENGGTPNGNQALQIRGTHHDGAGCNSAAGLDACTLNHDVVVFVQKIPATSWR